MVSSTTTRRCCVADIFIEQHKTSKVCPCVGSNRHQSNLILILVRTGSVGIVIFVNVILTVIFLASATSSKVAWQSAQRSSLLDNRRGKLLKHAVSRISLPSIITASRRGLGVLIIDETIYKQQQEAAILAPPSLSSTKKTQQQRYQQSKTQDQEQDKQQVDLVSVEESGKELIVDLEKWSLQVDSLEEGAC